MVTPSLRADLRVAPRRALVVEHDVAVGEAPDRDDLLGERDLALGRRPRGSRARGGGRCGRPARPSPRPRTSEASQVNRPSSGMRSVVERDLGRTDQSPAALVGVLADDLLQLASTSAASACWKRSASSVESANSNAVRRPDLVDATLRPASISLTMRLASSTGWTPLRNVLENRPSTRPTEPSFEVAEVRHRSTCAQEARPSRARRLSYAGRCDDPSVGCRRPVARCPHRRARRCGRAPTTGWRSRTARRGRASSSATRGSPSRCVARTPGSAPPAGTGAWPVGDLGNPDVADGGGRSTTWRGRANPLDHRGSRISSSKSILVG